MNDSENNYQNALESYRNKFQSRGFSIVKKGSLESNSIEDDLDYVERMLEKADGERTLTPSEYSKRKKQSFTRRVPGVVNQGTTDIDDDENDLDNVEE